MNAIVIANTISNQINRWTLLTLGAQKFLAVYEGGLSFKARILPYKKDGTRSSRPRLMDVTITLNALDYYDIKVTYVSRDREVLHFSASDVDCYELDGVLHSLDSMDPRPEAVTV